MFRKADDEHSAHITRIAWTACIAVLLLLSAILWATASARALSDSEIEMVAEPSSAVFAEAEEESEEVCLEGEDESLEVEEECEAEEEGSAEAECFLRTARARIVAYPSHDQIRLTLGYTTYAPTRATVEYRVRNGERLGTVSRRLGRSGVLRLSKHLGSGEMARASASHRFIVTLRLPEAPRDCQSYETPAAVLFK
jgi:vacuolar-type H+-ATPase subunit H